MKVVQLSALIFFFLLSLILPAQSVMGADQVLKDIRFNKVDGDLEQVVFLLNGPHIPKTFAIKGDRPRVVFDFTDTHPVRTMKTKIVTQGTMVEKIRVGLHGPPKKKTRVVLDLAPGGNFNFDQDFQETNNSLTISVYREKKKPKESVKTPPPKKPMDQEQKSEPVAKPVTEAAPAVQPALTPAEPLSGPPAKVESQGPPPVEIEGEKASEPVVKKPVASPAAEPVEPAVKQEDGPASDPILKQISFDASSNKGEMVLFKLNDFHPPLVFGVEEGLPRVVCDFMNARLEPEVIKLINAKGEFVDKVRTAVHKNPDKIRVVLDLVPNKNYDLQQVFFKEDNLFVIIVNSYGEVKK
ncbi:MAG: AMIN domain-containing protein [Thermodesulfobacteriota bacterium]